MQNKKQQKILSPTQDDENISAQNFHTIFNMKISIDEFLPVFMSASCVYPLNIHLCTILIYLAILQVNSSTSLTPNSNPLNTSTPIQTASNHKGTTY